MALREIMIWIIQAVLFGIGIGIAGRTAHRAGPLLATAFAIHELIPTAIVFFAVTAGLGWIGNRFWPEEWLYNSLLQPPVPIAVSLPPDRSVSPSSRRSGP